ncbi:hypothetical protein [Nonomuraea sp. NPDC050786]|uniref:hypothetical protein n=1 Tax=Nonomuraea sp. NPDC050786 TaxID=3154840 RepID=UPI0033D7112A
MTRLADRYWMSLIDTRTPASARMTRREWTGYGFWKRYWASLLDIPLVMARSGKEEPANDPLPVPRWRRLRAQLDPESGRFLLPLPPGRGVVTAAGAGGVVLRVEGPERLELLLYRIDGSEDDAQKPDYRLEVISPESDDLPLIVSVRYRRREDGAGQEVLIPLAQAPLGPPSSVVWLAGYDIEAPWHISQPVSAAHVSTSDSGIVRASVAAAASQATLNAWRQVADRVNERVRAVILEEMP